MELEKTGNGIEYDWYVEGPNGARFILYPKKGIHTKKDVRQARGWLYYNHDVVSMQIRWKLPDDTVAPPEKIPDQIIIKELRVEIGKLKAEIDEHEDKIREYKNKLNTEKQRAESQAMKEIRKELQREPVYEAIRKENSKLKKEVKNLRNTVSELITRCNKLEKKQ